MIYDCFPFFNELELLNIRLNELGDTVDKFVLIEADRTFSNKLKPFHFTERRAFFDRWKERIVVVKAMLKPEGPWQIEAAQRELAWEAVRRLGAKSNDVLMLSDVDEIPSANAVKVGLEHVADGDVCCEQRMYQYYLNSFIGDGWRGTRLATVGQIERDKLTMQGLRHKEPKVLLKNAGWHFGFMGGSEKISVKIKSYAHTEFDLPQYTDIEGIEARMKAGGDPFDRSLAIVKKAATVPLDELPAYVEGNPNIFAGWLKPPE